MKSILGEEFMLRKYGDHQPYHILKYHDKLNECNLKKEKKITRQVPCTAHVQCEFMRNIQKLQGLKWQINRPNHPFFHGVKAALYWLMRINY